MFTPNDIIRGALRLLGAISSGEDPSSAETSDGLSTLNEMIASWSNERLMMFADVEDLFDLVSGQQAYTWGSGGDFSTTRPLKIIEVALKVTNQSPNYELPVTVYNLDRWRGVIQKDVGSSIPTICYYDNNYPLGNISFYPKPTIAYKVIINSQKIIASFATSSDTVSLPEGYIRALKYNLAVSLAPEYGQEPSNTIFQIANESKAVIKRLNQRPEYLVSDAAYLNNNRAFNWLTGE